MFSSDSPPIQQTSARITFGCLLTGWMLAWGATTHVAATEQVVVLRNGNVFQGEIKRKSGQIIIRNASSELRMPVADVEFVAPNLSAAYRRKSRAVAKTNHPGRIQLIQWCHGHGLRSEAIQELEVLRTTAPQHPQLASLTQQLASVNPGSRTTELPLEAPLPLDRRYGIEHREKLSKEALSTYASTIQPLLLNRCSQAGCHGRGSANSYALIPTLRSRMSTGITETNLGATLRQIDRQQPHQTLLWMSANSAHGPLDSRPLRPHESLIVRSWVEAVSRELYGMPDENQHDPIDLVSGEQSIDQLDVDPFDPAVFNAETPTETDEE